MELVESEASCEPFPSMMHAFLFMLVHSPRPIVGSHLYVVIIYSLALLQG